MTVSLLPRRAFHALPRRSQEVDDPGEGFLEPNWDCHHQVERERSGPLALRYEKFTGEPAPAEALVERHQARLADEQAEIDIALPPGRSPAPVGSPWWRAPHLVRSGASSRRRCRPHARHGLPTGPPGEQP